MNPSDVIERLESLWFSTNILSPINENVNSVCENVSEEKPTELIVEEKEEDNVEFSISVSPPHNCQQSHSPRSETSLALLKCPRCGEFSAEIQTQFSTPAAEEEVEMPKSPEKTETKRKKRRSRRRRSRRMFNAGMKIFGEFDLGLECYGVYDPWKFEEELRELEGFGTANSQQLRMLLPLKDDMAMKQHLKSWAYAVACAVK